jgi:transposase
MEFELFMGCDISQDTFNFCLRNKAENLVEGKIENSTKSIKAWLTQLKRDRHVDLSRVIFCMEHTGVYGALLLRELVNQSLTIFVVSAREIKLSIGFQRGKNDKVDAKRIANYAMSKAEQLQPWKPKRPVLNQLQVLIRLRERLINSRKEISSCNKEAKRFLTKEEYQLLIKNNTDALKGIEKSIEKADKNIQALIMNDENLKHLCQLITSVDGIGMVTCSVILVKSNEFQDFTQAKKFACTAGIAPFEHTSGTSVRGRTRVSHSAHKDLKTLIHMCAVGSITRKGDLQDYYKRKVADGKNKMSVLNAIRNKLIHRVFAVVRNNTMYQKNYQYNLSMS